MKNNTPFKCNKKSHLRRFIDRINIVFLLLLFATASLYALPHTGNSNSVDQNNKTVKGRVIDAKGEPVFMVSVSLKGTTIGTNTDDGGNYQLDIPTNAENQILAFSFIGYIPIEESVKNRATINITLHEDVTLLDEVLVVGYGVQKKATVTGSIAQVSGKDIQKSTAANLSNSLVGRMPGVVANNRSGEPGNDFSDIYIRGKGTFGENAPLYVIDGVANRGGIERLNPSDIESITVLKDASAAIYGAQAANGVILVTTKRGNTSSKPVITYDGNFSLTQFTKLPNLMNSYEYMTYTDEISERYGRTQQFANIKGGYLDGSIDPLLYGDTDWMKAIFRDNAPQTQHSLSIRGGTEKIKYYVSGGVLYQEPLFKETKFSFKTFQIRSNLDAQITKDLTMSVEIAARQEDRRNSNYDTGVLFWEAMHAYPYLHDYYPNGLPGPGIGWGNNLALIAKGETGYSNTRDTYMNNKVAFNLNMPWITEGLSVGGHVAYDIHFRNNKKLMNQWDAFRYNAQTEEYDNIRSTTGDGNINLFQRSDNDNMTSALLKLAYTKAFGDHNVSGFVAYEQSKTKADWFSAFRRDYLSDKVQYLYAGGDSQKGSDGRMKDEKNKQNPGGIIARQNYFGRLNYAYQGRYLAEFTLRRDASQNFASENRWGWFPGVSLGWRISDESFFKTKFVDDLKLKASWGKLGNDRIDPFQFLNTYDFKDGPQFGWDPQRLKGITLLRTANPIVTWEKVDTKNVGFESVLLNTALSFDFQYFYSKRTDILTPRSAAVPDYTGLILPDENLGEISNKGIEIEATYRNKVNDVKYHIGGNFTYVRNKIDFMDEATNISDWQRRTGYPIDSWLLYMTDGIYKTQEEIDNSPHLAGTKVGDIKYLDINGDQSITAKDQKRIYQSATPEIIYGITMGAQWKGFELNMLWSGQARAKQLILPYSYNRDVTYFDNRWTPETPNAKYPRAFDRGDNYNGKESDFWLKDASFLRLKNLEVAYSFNADVLSKLKVEGLRVYLSGFNLFNLIDHIKVQDPEGNNSRGMYYPQQRIYTIGLNLSF